MKSSFTIPWNGVNISVDVKGDFHDMMFVLHLPQGEKTLVLDTDENGIKHWIEPHKGETAFAAEIGSLIELQELPFLSNDHPLT